MEKNTLINLVIVICVVILAVIILLNSGKAPETTEEIAKCIGENSILYVQLGCSHCRDQEDMFGEFKDKLTIIDCFYERDKCADIEATPSWKIKGELYEGVQSIENLKELTGC